jgi:redox-sensitive bicupin YhaK (pirin superfamily)
MASRRDVVRALAAGIPAGALAACRLEAPRAGGVGSGAGGPAGARPREVANLVDAQPTVEGAGVKLRRALGSRALPMLDPFLLLDEIHSERPDDYLAGFPTHPHRGFETVTYVLHGAMEHRDSLGNQGHLGPGSAQWMTAGHGIVHSEMPQQEKGLMWGFQLWVNLPAANKLIRPRYQDIPPERVTETIVDDARVRLVAGEVGGRRGPVEGIVTAPEMLDVALSARGSMRHPLPASHNAFLYVIEGAVEVGAGKTPVREGQLAVLGPGDLLALRSPAGGRLLCLAGRPLGEPVARYGPFVMNTDDEIRQAIDDYRSGRLVGG